MKFLATRFEVLFSLLVIMAYQGIFWPPNSYFITPNMPLDASDPWSAALNASLLAFLAVALVCRRHEMLALARPAWPILALLALALASILWSEAPFLTLRRATTLTGTTMFGVYLAGRFSMAELVSLLVKTSAIAAVASLVVMAVAHNTGVEGSVDYPTAWRGAFSDKNTLGLWAAFDIAVAAYALRRGYGSRAIALAVIPVNLLLLRFSQSGTPIVVLMGALYAAIAFGVLRQRNGFGLALGFLLLVLGALSLAVIGLEWNEILAALNRNPTLTGRDTIWHMVLGYIAQKPWLGYGYGAFWRHDGLAANTIWDTLQWTVPHAHNALLEIGLDLGIVGMAAVVLLWLDGCYRALRVLTVPQARHSVFILVLFVGILIENIPEFEFMRSNGFLWVLFVALFVHAGREALRYRATARPSRPPAVAAIAYPAPPR